MFAAAAENLVVGSKLLLELLGSDVAARAEIVERMRAAEHAGDDTTHAIFHQLNSSFITPFDREDIYNLASSLDDIMDFMEEAVDLVVLYDIQTLPKGVEEQIEVLARAAELTAEAMPRLRSMAHLNEYWIEIKPAGEPGGPDPPQAARPPVQRPVRGDRGAQAQAGRGRARGGRRRVRARRQHGGDHRRQGVLTSVDMAALICVIGVAFFFTYTNGFHDSANAIATSVSTRALTPKAALAMAAVMNLAGAFLGSGVAQTVSKGLIETPHGSKGMTILFGALVGAIA